MKKNKTILYLFIALLIYFFAVTIVYLVESSKSDSNIKSFSDAVWYSIITQSARILNSSG